MATSNLTPYTPIPNGSEATPGLWDTRFDQLQKNIVSVNTIQDSGIFPSGVSGPISDYGGQVYNVKAYGAVGDGVTDDSVYFQEALNSLGDRSFFSFCLMLVCQD